MPLTARRNDLTAIEEDDPAVMPKKIPLLLQLVFSRSSENCEKKKSPGVPPGAPPEAAAASSARAAAAAMDLRREPKDLATSRLQHATSLFFLDWHAVIAAFLPTTASSLLFGGGERSRCVWCGV